MNGGWRRLGLVLLICWWAWCGFVIVAATNEINRLKETWELANGNAERLLITEDEPSTRLAAHNYLRAKANIKNASIWAFLLPILLSGLFFLVRWVAAGFRQSSAEKGVDRRN